MDSIPTDYNGVTYRSRTEARWAAFFDCLSLKFDFEPGYFADAWGTYTPDFYIFRDDDLEIGPFWVEVKGRTPSAEEKRKLRHACNRMRCEGLLLVGWPEEVGEMYYYSPLRDGQDDLLRQTWLDLLLGADRACFSRARAIFLEPAEAPLESPLLTVTEPVDIARYPSASPMPASTVLKLIMQANPPTGATLALDWRAQRRALDTLLKGNETLSVRATELSNQIRALTEQMTALRKENADLEQTNSWLRFIVYIIGGMFILLGLAVAIFR